MATFKDAVDSMIGSQRIDAIKRPSWKGYVRKEVIPLSPTAPSYLDWGPETAYSVDDRVKVGNGTDMSYYICRSAHTSGAEFQVGSNWTQLDDDGFRLVFVEGTDPDEGKIGHDGVTSYAFRFTARTSGYDLVYRCTEAPVTSSGEVPATHVLEIDAGLMESFLADDWITGSSADFDEAATGTSRW